MDFSAWLSVTREDGETVGYLEPLAKDYSMVQPRSLLGHLVGQRCDFLAGEQLLQERGISELAQSWTLHNAPDQLQGPLSILEVSPDGIVVADALQVKALLQGERKVIAWPDVEHQLIALTDH